MKMGGRAENLEIELLFLFKKQIADGEFAMFGTPVMGGESMRW